MGTIRILAVGDVMLGEQGILLGRGVLSKAGSRGEDFIFEKVRPLLAGADLVFGNLEAVLSDHSLDVRRLSSRWMRGSPRSIAALRRTGFDLLSVANNHLLDHGREVFDDTVAGLAAAGIAPVGLRDAAGSALPVVRECRGMKVGFLGCSFASGRGGEGGYPFCQSPSEDSILSGISSLASSTQAVVLSLHWGSEFMSHPSAGQIAFAHRAVDAGARIILGHHPHCLQGIERYQGGVICYSLGDFVFDFWQRSLRESIVAVFELSSSGEVSFSALPVFINRHFQPVPAEGSPRGERIGKRLDRLSRDLNRSMSLPAARYLARVRSVRRRMRRSFRLNFALNLWRYPLPFWGQALRQFLRGRKR